MQRIKSNWFSIAYSVVKFAFIVLTVILIWMVHCNTGKMVIKSETKRPDGQEISQINSLRAQSLAWSCFWTIAFMIHIKDDNPVTIIVLPFVSLNGLFEKERDSIDALDITLSVHIIVGLLLAIMLIIKMR